MDLELPHWNRNGCMLPVPGSYCPNLYTYPQYGVLSDRIPTLWIRETLIALTFLAFPIPEASPHLRVREFFQKSRVCTNFIDLENSNKTYCILGIQSPVFRSASRRNPGSFQELLQLGRLCNRWEQSSCHNYCRESDLHSCGKPSNSIIPYLPSLDLHSRIDAQHAALLNGIASHVHDYDDTHLDTIIHPTGPVASALLAVAEWKGGFSGKEFLSL
jgi:hypothetical protein